MDEIHQLDQLQDDLRAAGISAAALDEAVALAQRDPSEVSIAVVGPHNVGKTTLIAALTGDDRALEDVAPTIKTTTSERYRLSLDALTVDVWDTPGLGTEHFEHDAETRERVTKADALVIAVSSELLSDRAREDLRKLLIVGRKVGATVFVVTKADREPGDRAAIEKDLADELHPVPREQTRPHWVAARDFIETDSASGVPELLEAVRALATGAAREHLRYTAAVRLVHLIDEALPQLADEDEVELQAGLRLQQRLHAILRDGARTLERGINAHANQLALVAARSAAVVTDAYEEGLAADGDATDVVEQALRSARAGFDREAERLSSELDAELRRRFDEIATGCDRLEASQLAAAIREIEVGMTPHAARRGRPAPVVDRAWKRPGYVDDIKGVLDNVVSVGAAFTQAQGYAFGGFEPLSGAVSGLVEIYYKVKENQDRERRVQQADAAKSAVRREFDRRAKAVSNLWWSELDAVRAGTLGPAIEATLETERRLDRQLGSAQDRAQRLRTARAELEAAIPAEAWQPAATQAEIAEISTT